MINYYSCIQGDLVQNKNKYVIIMLIYIDECEIINI